MRRVFSPSSAIFISQFTKARTLPQSKFLRPQMTSILCSANYPRIHSVPFRLTVYPTWMDVHLFQQAQSRPHVPQNELSYPRPRKFRAQYSHHHCPRPPCIQHGLWCRISLCLQDSAGRDKVLTAVSGFCHWLVLGLSG